MFRYFEVKVNKQKMFVRVSQDSADRKIMRGMRVTDDGTLWDKMVDGAIQMNIVFFSKSDIVREVQINLTYGEFETVAQQGG